MIVHDTKKEWLENGDRIINKLLLKNKRKEYLKSNYNFVINQIEKFIGKEVNVYQLIGLINSTLKKTQEIESKSKNELESLALSSVLDLSEFKMVKECYFNNQIKFDCKIGEPELERSTQEEEEVNLDFMESEEEKNNDDILIKRRFTNLIITGSGSYHFYLYRKYKTSLYNINEELISLYDILVSIVELFYWITPINIEKKSPQLGSSEVNDTDDDVYTVKVRAKTFCYLQHEIVKGIYEWLSLKEEFKGVYANECIEDETFDFLIGRKFFEYFYNKLVKEELPLIYKKILNLPTKSIIDIVNDINHFENVLNNIKGI